MRLRKQISEFIKNDEDIVFENIKKIVYLDWIQNETTRHYGPVNGQFFKVATEDNFIKDIPVSKGTLATTQVLANHYNPNYFPKPE